MRIKKSSLLCLRLFIFLYGVQTKTAELPENLNLNTARLLLVGAISSNDEPLIEKIILSQKNKGFVNSPFSLKPLGQSKKNQSLCFLDLAALLNKGNIIKTLIQCNADPDIVNEETNSTPLSVAIETASPEAVDTLIKLGASPHKIVNGETPLELAARIEDMPKKENTVNRKAIVGIIFNAINSRVPSFSNIKNAIIANQSIEIARQLNELKKEDPRFDVNSVINGKTLLMIASELGRNEIAIKLLAQGANPLAKNRNGESALSVAGSVKTKALLTTHIENHPEQFNDSDCKKPKKQPSKSAALQDKQKKQLEIEENKRAQLQAELAKLQAEQQGKERRREEKKQKDFVKKVAKKAAKEYGQNLAMHKSIFSQIAQQAALSAQKKAAKKTVLSPKAQQKKVEEELEEQKKELANDIKLLNEIPFDLLDKNQKDLYLKHASDIIRLHKEKLNSLQEKWSQTTDRLKEIDAKRIKDANETVYREHPTTVLYELVAYGRLLNITKIEKLMLRGGDIHGTNPLCQKSPFARAQEENPDLARILERIERQHQERWIVFDPDAQQQSFTRPSENDSKQSRMAKSEWAMSRFNR